MAGNPGSPEITLLRPTTQMAFACENISTDFAGRMSFQNVIDTLSAATFPAQTPGFFVVFGFASQTAGFLINPRMEIIGPDNAKLVEAKSQDLPFRPDVPIARAIFGFPGISWPIPGTYNHKISSERWLLSFVYDSDTAAATTARSNP
jgi:hypothetical protein